MRNRELWRGRGEILSFKHAGSWSLSVCGGLDAESGEAVLGRSELSLGRGLIGEVNC